MNQNIITIKQQDITAANEAFAFLMAKAENMLNRQAVSNPKSLKGISAFDLEQLSCKVIKDACSGTPFRPGEVRLISGAKFPDIVAEKYYGVEVKSTNKNHWTSTGSSIVESTRDKYVEYIYMLFAKLGGTPEFKCRPYQDVMSEIAVTHCPRYLIDMNLEKGNTIFDKMQTSYDKLRNSSDCIEQVRKYYRNKASEEGKVEMPWWLSDGSTEDMTTSINVGFWKDLPLDAKQLYQAQIFILFPEVLNSDYDKASLWLCTTKGVLHSHIRDTFTAGGTVKIINGKAILKPLPQIYKKLVNLAPIIKNCLKDSDFINTQVRVFNPLLLNKEPYSRWIDQITLISGCANLEEWIETEAAME